MIFALIGLFLISGFLFWQKMKAGSDKLIWEERACNSSEKLQELIHKLNELEEENRSLNSFRGRYEQAQILIDDLKLQNQTYQRNLEALNYKIADTEKRSELLNQTAQNLQKEKLDWSREKEAILFKLSEEIIRKNHEEQSKFGKNQQEIIAKITEDLHKNFHEVLLKVNSLDDDVKKSGVENSLIKNALLNPGGAGRTSEITLENILKSSGLREKINIDDIGDFMLQSHFSGSDQSGKRPDAIVFMPGNQILIIDSKSSPYFLEFQQAVEKRDLILEKEILGKIKESMRRHLEDLKKKDYAKAKLEEIGLKDFAAKDMPVVNMVMFLQTEKMLETVRIADTDLEHKALQAGIPMLSPIGLINLLTQAKYLIDRTKQEENIAALRVEITKMINAIAAIFAKSEQLGKSISKSLKSYNEFAGTFNRTFLPRVKNMGKLGVEIENKNSLKTLSKIEAEGNLIEGEVLEVEE